VAPGWTLIVMRSECLPQADPGLGTGDIPNVYPSSAASYQFFFNEAHNDYLQLLVEMGASAAAPCSGCCGGLSVWNQKVEKNCPERHQRAVAWQLWLGVTGILVTALWIFNLQIPAMRPLFYVLCTVLRWNQIR